MIVTLFFPLVGLRFTEFAGRSARRPGNYRSPAVGHDYGSDVKVDAAEASVQDVLDGLILGGEVELQVQVETRRQTVF